MLIEINARRYRISCDKDKEDDLCALAARLDRRARAIASENNGKPEQVMLLLCLSLLEELDAAGEKNQTSPPPGFELRAARALMRAGDRIEKMSQHIDAAMHDEESVSG